MRIGHIKLRKMRWLGLLIFVVFPLLLSPEWFREIKIAGMLRHNRIEDSLIFRYAGIREVSCYNENPDDSEKMSYIFLPSFADPKEIEIETIAYQVKFVQEGVSFQVRSGKAVKHEITIGEPYDLSFYDILGKEIGTKRLMFLKSEKLPTLYVFTKTGGMQRLDADKKYKEDGWVELLDVEGNVIFSDELRSISARGNQTFSFEKKSYQLNMKEDVNLLGMGRADAWILLSNVYDPSYIRNKLTYEMAEQAGMPASPDSEYIDVYFNGIYGGLYQLCEKVEIGENRLEIADLERQNRMLNGDALDYVDTFSESNGTQKGTELVFDPEDITGGYLLERDYGEKFEEVISGFITKRGDHFALKNPSHASKKEVAYINRLVQEIEDAICAPDGVNPETGKRYTDYIDLKSWADKYLVEEITRNNGGGATSSFFYKPQDSVSHKVFGGPVWDYDKGYGNASGYNQNTGDLGFLTLHADYTSWFSELYQQSDFVEMVKREYANGFSDYLQTMADEKIDAYLEQIDAATILDRARFGHVYREFGEEALDYKAQAEKVRQFIRERKIFLDKVWLENAPVCKVYFRNGQEEKDRCLGVIKGSCIQELPTEIREGMVFQGWRKNGAVQYLTTETPIEEDMTVYSVFAS